MGKGDPPKNYVDAVAFPDTVTLEPIGVVVSPYKERHGTPHQSTVVTEQYDEAQTATLRMFKHKLPIHALQDLDSMSHIWVISWFHLNKHWNPMVLPPRGPRKKRGTLSTRAPHRPNPIGLSVCEIVEVNKFDIVVKGIDLLDGTPILDIKPYLPYCDSFPEADIGWVKECGPPKLADEE